MKHLGISISRNKSSRHHLSWSYIEEYWASLLTHRTMISPLGFVRTSKFIHDCIAVPSIFFNNSRQQDSRPSLITVINAYAPHLEEANLFYQQLQTTTQKYRYSTLLYIAGDFNAIAGRRNDESEAFLGWFS